MLEALTVGLFVLACAMALWRASWALALVVLMFPFEQALQASSGIFLSSPALTNYVIALVAGVAALKVLFTRPQPFKFYFNAPFWCTIIIFGWTGVSLIWTPSREKALGYMSDDLPYFVLFILVAPFLVRGIESMSEFARVMLYLGAMVLCVLLLNPAFTVEGGRLGILLAPNVRTNPLAIGEAGGALIIVAALLRVGPLQWAMNLARIAAFLSGSILALQSGSRGQLIFAVLLAIVFYPVSKRVKDLGSFLGASIGGLVIGAGVLLLAQTVLQSERAIDRWDVGQLDDGFLIRMANIGDLLAAWLVNPIAWVFGMGFNAFSSLGSKQAQQGYSHNMTVDMLTEQGIPVFVVYVAMLYITGRAAVWLYRRYANSPAERSTASLIMAMITYQFLLTNKQGMLWATPALFMYAIMLVRLQRTEEAEGAAAGAPDEYEQFDMSTSADGVQAPVQAHG